ncbi:MAG: hypothetical protein IJT83_03530 [Victivallales bacterium]|nr:hypothetical protein [Victivallales bacterium]
MKKLFSVILLLTTAFVFAEVKPGENLILNPDLEADQLPFPTFWISQGARQNISYISAGGPGGKGFLRLTPKSGIGEEVSARQYGIALKAGEKYKISAMVRTNNFNSPNAGICIVNNGWNNDIGISNKRGNATIPANTDWKYLEREFTLMPSNNNTYFVALFASRFTGTLDITEIKLEAISEGALKNSGLSAIGRMVVKPTLIPWTPLLHAIDEANREMTFKFFGKLAGDVKEYDIALTTSDSTTAVRQPLVYNENKVVLPKDAKSGSLKVAIVQRSTGKQINEVEFTFDVVSFPKVDASTHKRLNNFATEVLNKPVEGNIQNFTFGTTKNGWVFFAVKNADPTAIKVVLDGVETIIDAETPRAEAFREIGIGEHTLAVSGAKGGTVIAHAICDVFNYCPGSNSGVSTNPPYNWDFQMKYGMPAITTQNGGSIPVDKRDWLHKHGYKWLANLASTNLKDEHDLTERLEKCGGMNQPFYDGVTCDEQFFGQPFMIQLYTAGLKAFKNPQNKLIFTWIAGKPGMQLIDHDFMATSINASKSRGKLIYEAYCRTKASQKEAQEYLETYVTDTIKRFKLFYPNAEKSTGIIFGDFNQVPILSLAHHPEVDYKYYLDMQLNLVANNPNFKDIGCTGYWGSYYADHELHRWAYMLLRHYCVEGNTTMLSDKYGFSYMPNHVVNGDFRGNLDGWTVKGNVTTDKFQGFASSSQNRWGGNNGIGDTFAVLTKNDAVVSSVTQNAVNLVPGKAYCLQFATFDVDDVKAKRINPRKFGITAHLSEGADIQDKLSWHFVDKREKGRYAYNNGVARINLVHIVFIAKSNTVTITLDNAAALKGEKLGINYLSLNPFLMEE